jgi:hypothetical protein
MITMKYMYIRYHQNFSNNFVYPISVILQYLSSTYKSWTSLLVHLTW